MKFLFDTNLIIPAEPTGPDDIEPGTPVIVELLGLIQQAQHQTYLHPESLRELGNDRNQTRRQMRQLLLAKYLVLQNPPPISKGLEAAIGTAQQGTHDFTDHSLLAAIAGDAVDLLVTDDRGILRKARLAGFAPRVMTAADCAATIRGLFRKTPSPPPAVLAVLAHQLDDGDPIFNSFERDYPGFAQWLRTCKREHRRCWTIQRPAESLAGVCIVKDEPNGEFDIPGPALKLCSFKIADGKRGFRFGELLLKAVFSYVFQNNYDTMYVTVLPKYDELLGLFEEFGFVAQSMRTSLGELILAKQLTCGPAEYQSTPPLEFNVRYGPHHLKVGDLPIFVVPIVPAYHELLFPECEAQQSFLAGTTTFGNSIAKAYLCHAPTRQIVPGSLLLFYRSRDLRQVQCLGVAEETSVSSDPVTIARFVGKRTVYSFAEIERMCDAPTLAIRFRQTRSLTVPFRLADLIARAVVKRAPQSITVVAEEGREWLRDHVENGRWRSFPFTQHLQTGS